jgi:hypothetical protein
VKPELPDRRDARPPAHCGKRAAVQQGCGLGGHERLLLGPIPHVPAPVVVPPFGWSDGPPDIGWRLLREEEPDSFFGKVWDSWVGFGLYHKNGRPGWHAHEDVDSGSTELVRLDEYERMRPEIADAYRAAASARFEHGETPGSEPHDQLARHTEALCVTTVHQLITAMSNWH